MKQTLFSLVKEFIKVVIIVAIAVPFISLFADWSEPSSAPTAGNAAAPINVGPLDQIKSGGWLSLGNLISRGTTLLAKDGGNVGIGTVSPISSASPTNNEASGNADINDVYLRSTNKWLSQMSGGGGVCPPPRQQILIEGNLLCIKDGVSIETYCQEAATREGPYGVTIYDKIKANAYARFQGGQFQVRAKGDNNIYTCDSGWVNGFSAQCSRPGMASGATIKPSGVTVSAGTSVAVCSSTTPWP